VTDRDELARVLRPHVHSPALIVARKAADAVRAHQAARDNGLRARIEALMAKASASPWASAVEVADLRRALRETAAAPDPGPDPAAPVKSALEEEGSP
jgi:hypothetical protein